MMDTTTQQGIHATAHFHANTVSLPSEALVFPRNIVSGLASLGSWDALVSRFEVEQTQNEHYQMQQLLHAWSHAFLRDPKHETFAMRVFGTPSLIVRADYFMHSDGIKLCEIEERPAGIAVTALLNQTFKRRTSRLFETLENMTAREVAVVISEGREGTSDDLHWTSGALHRRMKVFRGMPSRESRNRHLFYVRANRNEEEYWGLNSESISTIAQEGDKSYGISMNLWKPISDPDSLPWKSGVVLKPSVGSRFEEVLLCRDGKKLPGMHTITRGRTAIAENRVEYAQEFFEPETPGFLNPRGQKHEIFMLRRAFWGLDPLTENWVSLGGLWMANPTVRIHGSRASLCGPLAPAHI